MSAPILRSASLIWRLTSRRRGMIEATWALAASTVPAASFGGGARTAFRIVGGVEAADASLFEQLGDLGLAQPDGLGGRRGEREEVEQPLGAAIVFEFEKRGKIAPELLAQAVGQAIALDAEFFGDARPFPQFDEDRLGGSELAKALDVGAQTRGHHLGVAAVVFSSGHRETVAEAVHLLRVDRMDREAALDQVFDDGPVRNLDGDEHRSRLCGGAGFQQPGRHLGEALATVFEEFLADFTALVVGQEDAMAFASPIDAGIPTLRFAHGRTSRTQCRAAAIFVDPCTGARPRKAPPARTPHWTSITANLSGHKSPPGGRATGGNRSLPRDRLGPGNLHLFARAIVLTPFRYATLRENNREDFRNRVKKVQGVPGRRGASWTVCSGWARPPSVVLAPRVGCARGSGVGRLMAFDGARLA